MHILLIYGGDSPERDVSLRSGKAIYDALISVGHAVATFDPQTDKNLSVAVEGADVAFIALHGVGGEDGTIQHALTELQVPFVGSDEHASHKCFQKDISRSIAAGAGLFVADGSLVTYDQFINNHLTKQAFVLKPINDGSSIDTFIVRDTQTVPHAELQAAFRRHQGVMLIERLIEGTEVTAGVYLESALPLIEIIPPSDQEFDYENKYNGKTVELCPPQSISDSVQKRVQSAALAIHRALGCRDVSRSDFIIDDSGIAWYLETNTIPGMTATSLLPKMLAANGISLTDFADHLVRNAVSRR